MAANRNKLILLISFIVILSYTHAQENGTTEQSTTTEMITSSIGNGDEAHPTYDPEEGNSGTSGVGIIKLIAVGLTIIACCSIVCVIIYFIFRGTHTRTTPQSDITAYD